MTRARGTSMTADTFEYAIKKDVRNNPIVREVDRNRQRELWRSVGVGGILVSVLLFSAWQHFELLRHGYRPPAGPKAWTERYGRWLSTVRFEAPAKEATRVDYMAEVEHARERISRLERALDEAIEATPAAMRAVIDALQALRGIAKLAAATIVAEVGQLSRFDRARQLMGYSGAVASEHSSGLRVRRGAITKTGNAHLRHIVVEAAWSYRHQPRIGPTLRQRQVGQRQAVKAIAWKAQHRLHGRYQRLLARGKVPQQVVTAVARELLGFIWAIGVAVEAEQPDRRVA